MSNREQRRLAERFKMSNQSMQTISMTPSELSMKLNIARQEGYNKGANEGCDWGVRLSMGMAFLALLDKNHISKEDVQDSWKDVIYKADCLKKGYCTADDIYSTLKEEYDIIL